MARKRDSIAMTETFADRYHARRAEAVRAEAQSDAVYAACCRAVMRAMSDHARAYRTCPAQACRRARRCDDDSLHCRDLMKRMPLSWIDESLLIDEVYNDVVRQRCSAGRRE